jgi:hypothetical protein
MERERGTKGKGNFLVTGNESKLGRRELFLDQT